MMTGVRHRQSSNRHRFGAAHLARSLAWSFVDLLFAWHLHATVGLTGVQTGWVLCGFLAVGGGATFVAGVAFSRARAAGAAVVRIQLAATIATVVLLLIQFSVERLPAIIAAGLMFRIAYAVQDVSQNMLASMLPTGEEDVSRYARLRVILSAISRCVVTGGYGFVSGRLTMLLLMIGAAMIASSVALRQLTFPDRRPNIPASAGIAHIVPMHLPLLLCAWATAASIIPTVGRLLIFAPAIDGLPGVGGGSGAWLLGVFCIGSILGPMRRTPIDRMSLLAVVAASGMAMTMPMATEWANPSRLAGAFFHGWATSIIGVRLWAATSHIAIEDARSGRSSDGIVFGSVILTLHLGSAAGMLILGPLIEEFEAGRSGAAIIAMACTTAGAAVIAALGFSETRTHAAA